MTERASERMREFEPTERPISKFQRIQMGTQSPCCHLSRRGFSLWRPKWVAGSNPLQTNYSLQKLLIKWGSVWGGCYSRVLILKTHRYRYRKSLGQSIADGTVAVWPTGRTCGHRGAGGRGDALVQGDCAWVWDRVPVTDRLFENIYYPTLVAKMSGRREDTQPRLFLFHAP